jgi:hypothetical protein
VLQKILNASKRIIFYNQTKGKRVKGALVFSRRIYFCNNYTLISDALKNFATQPADKLLPIFGSKLFSFRVKRGLSMRKVLRGEKQRNKGRFA